MMTTWACIRCDRLVDLIGLLDDKGRCSNCRNSLIEIANEAQEQVDQQNKEHRIYQSIKELNERYNAGNITRDEWNTLLKRIAGEVW